MLAPTIQPAKNSFGVVALCVVLVLLVLWTWSLPQLPPSVPALAGVSPPFPVRPIPLHSNSSSTASDLSAGYVEQADRVKSYLTSYPLSEDDFGQMGKRLQILKEWMHILDAATSEQRAELHGLEQDIEQLAVSLVPFIKPPRSRSRRPLQKLRRSFSPRSRGIVITTGKKRFRFACHLILNLRVVLGSDLAIQIAYAGDEDLPRAYREAITGFGRTINANVTTFDVTRIFDNKYMDLPNGGWAIKAFAVLGSTFEQVMLLDADDIFLQKPEVVFDSHPGYLETGTLLFHDRLLWQNSFEDRHKWWESELSHTNLSETIKHSKVFVEKFAEEGDSGVVVVNKSRLEVLIGLLHITWQNTKAPREKWTFRQCYGDKESWWFGFELAGTPYSFEKHYASIVGHAVQSQDGKSRVCSFTIAHLDHNEKLLWYNGSLLKNKEINGDEFDVPGEWMVDGTWEKGASKKHFSCMSGGEIRQLQAHEVEVLRNTVEGAVMVDQQLKARGFS